MSVGSAVLEDERKHNSLRLCVVKEEEEEERRKVYGLSCLFFGLVWFGLMVRIGGLRALGLVATEEEEEEEEEELGAR